MVPQINLGFCVACFHKLKASDIFLHDDTVLILYIVRDKRIMHARKEDSKLNVEWWKGLQDYMFRRVSRFDSFSVLRVCCCWASESYSYQADPLCASQCKHFLIYLRICSALGEVTYWIVLFFYDGLGWRWANQKADKRSRSKKNMQTCNLNTKDSIICSKRRGCS